MGQDPRRTGTEHFGEGPADAVEHRVAAGQDGEPAPGVRGEQAGDGRPQRRGPWHPLSPAGRREQGQLPLTADENLCVDERRARRVGQSSPSVGADSHDGHRRWDGLFGWSESHGRYLGVQGMTQPNSTVRP